MRPDSCGVETRRGSRTLATLSTAPWVCTVTKQGKSLWNFKQSPQKWPDFLTASLAGCRLRFIVGLFDTRIEIRFSADSLCFLWKSGALKNLRHFSHIFPPVPHSTGYKKTDKNSIPPFSDTHILVHLQVVKSIPRPSMSVVTRISFSVLETRDPSTGERKEVQRRPKKALCMCFSICLVCLSDFLQSQFLSKSVKLVQFPVTAFTSWHQFHQVFHPASVLFGSAKSITILFRSP